MLCGAQVFSDNTLRELDASAYEELSPLSHTEALAQMQSTSSALSGSHLYIKHPLGAGVAVYIRAMMLQCTHISANLLWFTGCLVEWLVALITGSHHISCCEPYMQGLSPVACEGQ